jgi:aerobic carbon-monoxide dehydrogenase medium subunit
MIPAAFEYYRPQTVQDAAGRLAELGDDAKMLAGGHSLLPLMRLRFAAPAALVDIQDLSELRFAARDGDRVRIGALTRHRDIEAHPAIRESVPLLAKVAAEIGDVQIRNRGTIGGSVAHADPAGEYATVCLMLDAEIVTTKRSIPASDFFIDRFTTPLGPDELVTELAFPVTPGRVAGGSRPGSGRPGPGHLPGIDLISGAPGLVVELLANAGVKAPPGSPLSLRPTSAAPRCTSC